MNFPPVVAKHLLPFAGEGFVLKLKKPEALEKLLEAKVPSSPDEANEVTRAVKLRINQRYNEKGGWDRSSVGPMLVDLWVQRAGLAFATHVLLKACSSEGSYKIRHDGQPWRRLREHVAASKDPKAAHGVAAQFWKSKGPLVELRCALAFAFGDDAWVEEMIDPMFEHGYGCWSVLAAVRDPAQALALMKRIVKADLRFQLYEEAVVFLPTLVKTAGPPGRPVLEQLIAAAYNEKARKPLVDLLVCYG